MVKAEILILEDTFNVFASWLRYAKKELHACKTIGDFRKSEIAQMCGFFIFDGLETKDADPCKPGDCYVDLDEIPHSCDAYEWQQITFDVGFCMPDLCRLFYYKKTNTFENEKGADWQNDFYYFCDSHGLDETDPAIKETIKRGMDFLPMDGNNNGPRIDLTGIDID